MGIPLLPATRHWPSTLLRVFEVDAVPALRLEETRPRSGSSSSSYVFVVERERREDDPNRDLVAVVNVDFRFVTAREIGEECAGRRLDRLLL